MNEDLKKLLGPHGDLSRCLATALHFARSTPPGSHEVAGAVEDAFDALRAVRAAADGGALQAENAALKLAIVKMVLSYEALQMDDGSRKWIAPTIWKAIVEATLAAREAVATTVLPDRGASRQAEGPSPSVSGSIPSARPSPVEGPWIMEPDEHGETRRGWRFQERDTTTLEAIEESFTSREFWLDRDDFSEVEARAILAALNRVAAGSPTHQEDPK
jgi:hypothetical protein